MNKEEFNTLRADLGMTQKEVAEKKEILIFFRYGLHVRLKRSIVEY